MLILSRVVIALGVAGVLSVATTPRRYVKSTLASEASNTQPRTIQQSHRYLFMSDMTSYEAKQLCESLGIAFIRKLPSRLYLCIDRSKGTVHKTGTTRSILEELLDSPGVLSAEREEYIEMKLNTISYGYMTFDDPKWDDTWHLDPFHSPSSQVYDVWLDGITGHGVTVAIVDNGIQENHTDLLDNYRADLGYDAVNEDNDPSHGPLDNGHGTNCAGVVAAVANNSECSIGVAYNAKITAIKLLDAEVSSTVSSIAEALSHELDNIDIYSNSWSYITAGVRYVKMHDHVADALEAGVVGGRNGKGAIYTFSAGNGDTENEDTNEQTHRTSIYTIVIGNVSPDGSPAYYTTPGATVLAATYGGDLRDNYIGIITPDRYSGCMTNFHGTSAACPVASGIIALTLEANNNLTWRDVQHLIVYTSNNTVLSGDTFVTNGAGLIVSNYFGFGLMNAAAMVETAKTWVSVGPLLACQTEPRAVNEGFATEDEFHSLMVQDCSLAYIENVHVMIDIYTERKGNVQIFLISPAGTRSRLIRFRPGDTLNDLIHWVYGSVHFWGENPIGEWILELDSRYGTEHELVEWNMTFYGKDYDGCQGNPCQNDGTCVNTDDGYECQCSAGASGTNCEHYDGCLSNPCQNSGNCVNKDSYYKCECDTGYYGTHCEDFNECISEQCQNGGTCYDQTVGFNCSCAHGYSGTNCQDYDGCLSNPCQNSGSCVNKDNYYKCECDAGYLGTHCEDKNECLSDPCENGGICSDNASGYSCSCPSDYTGTNCQDLSSGNINSVYMLRSTVVFLIGLMFSIVFN